MGGVLAEEFVFWTVQVGTDLLESGCIFLIALEMGLEQSGEFRDGDPQFIALVRFC